jgi:hypothetical protein
MRADIIRDTPKSIESPARNSSTITLLNVSSDEAAAGGVASAEEEEDGIATYRRRALVGLLAAESKFQHLSNRMYTSLFIEERVGPFTN